MKKTNYDNIAEKYDKNPRRTQMEKDAILARYIESLHPHETCHVLDLACGTGTYLKKQAEAFQKINIHWVGVDASEGMLAKAKQKDVPAKLIHGYAEHLPFPDEKFDYIHNHYAFHHFSDKQAAIKEVKRVLKPGGVFRLYNLALHDMKDWWIDYYFPTARALQESRHWTKDEVFDMLVSEGFVPSMRLFYQKKEVKVSKYLIYAENRDISFLASLPDDAYEKGVEEMQKVVANDPNASISVDFAEMALTAVKK